ncbi:MAG: hypothetical protein E7607_01490 [Ruminococcaceae bacterium]|nr:hypothetical protein [Oscillospiraceae bacterium]
MKKILVCLLILCLVSTIVCACESRDNTETNNDGSITVDGDSNSSDDGGTNDSDTYGESNSSSDDGSSDSSDTEAVDYDDTATALPNWFEKTEA